MMFFEPEQMEDVAIDPITRTGKLAQKVEIIEEQINDGNTHRYITAVNATVATTGLVLGSTALSPLVSLLFLIGVSGAVGSYIAYVLFESSKLKINPVWLPTTAGEVDQMLVEILPTQEKILWTAIDNFGLEAVESLERQGYLDYLLRSIKAIKVRSRETAVEDFQNAIEQIGNHYFPQQTKLPQVPKLPRIDRPDDSPAPRGRNLPETPASDIWEDMPENHRTSDRLSLPTATDETFNWATITRRPHLFVLGDSGSGKTSLVQWLVTTHYPKNSEVLVLDPHDVKGQWGEFPTIGRGRNFDAVELALEKLVGEMDKRYSSGTYEHPPKIVIIEEIPAIAANCKTAMGSIASLTLEARKVKIFLIVLSQGWEVESLGLKGKGSVRDSFCFISLGQFAVKKAKEFGISSQIRGVDRPCFVGDDLAVIPELDGYVLAKQPDIRSSLDRLYQSSTAPEPTTTPEPSTPASKIASLDDATLDDLLAKVLNYAKAKGAIRPSDVTNNNRNLREYKAQDIMQLFCYLEGDGEGVIKDGKFIPN